MNEAKAYKWATSCLDALKGASVELCYKQRLQDKIASAIIAAYNKNEVIGNILISCDKKDEEV